MSKKKVNESRQRLWQLTRNRKRREKYAKDAAYRETIKASNRKSYQQGENFKQQRTLPTISQVAEFGIRRKVTVDGKVRERVTFTSLELAYALDYTEPVIYGWQHKGVLPEPFIVKEGFTPTEFGACVYTLPQVERLVAVLSDYFKEYRTRVQASNAKLVKQIQDAIKNTPY